MRARHTIIGFILTGFFLALAGTLFAAVAVDYAAARAAMVTTLRRQSITNQRVLSAMGKVPRHLFVPEAQRNHAYTDTEISVGKGEILNKPYVVALMTQTLDAKQPMHILEVGTGCGYQTAIIAECCSNVYTVEAQKTISNGAASLLHTLGYNKIKFRVGEELNGWPANAPYDAIIVNAAVDRVPDALVNQLKEGGYIVAPIGRYPEQTLNLISKTGDLLRVKAVAPIRLSASLTNPTSSRPR